MFRRIAIIMIVIAAMAVTVNAQKWEFDKAHSTIGFSVRHMVISKTTGRFEDYSGNVFFDGKNFVKGKVEITIQMASINTENQKRDDHLRSADFFNAEKFPIMTFISKKVISEGDDNFKIIGDLTIKDVTKEVVLDVEFHGVVTDPWGNTKAGFTAHTTINRQDFHVAWDNKLKDGSLIVGNDVGISLEIELAEAAEE